MDVESDTCAARTGSFIRGTRMGGFNEKTGVFSLTQSKAGVWCRKPNPDKLGLIDHCARLLRDAGHEVLSVHGNFLEVKAMPGQVWEALSGRPSDPKRESLHL